MNASRRTALKALAASPLATLGQAHAQEDKSPITVLVGAPTAMDSTARLVAEALRETLGRPAIVVQKLGAGQRLAVGEAKRAAPDGRTLVFTTSGVFTLYPHLYTRLDYDPEADFTPIASIAKFEIALAVSPSSGVTDYRQMVEQLRRQGQPVAVGTAPGAGSLPHFVGAAMTLHHGLQMTHVPYKDSPSGLNDLMGGRLPIMLSGYPALIELHRAGRIRLLAVTGDTRSPQTPEVPTFREVGFPINGTSWMGLYGPARMAPEVVARLHNAVKPMFNSPSVREKLNQQALVMAPMSPQEMTVALRGERKAMGEMVKASGYVPTEPD